MALYVIATPLGNPSDIGQRAKELLNSCDLLIGEEAKELRARLKLWGIPPQKQMRLLNEHTSSSEISELAELCQNLNVALVSDCGTPGFFDPGPELVTLLRQKNIPVWSVPGPSSLAAFVSVSGYRFNEFFYAGFLPAKEEQREAKWRELQKLNVPIFIMDTPYRFKKVVAELKKTFPKREVIIGCDLSTDIEKVTRLKIKDLNEADYNVKPEFLLCILAGAN